MKLSKNQKNIMLLLRKNRRESGRVWFPIYPREKATVRALERRGLVETQECSDRGLLARACAGA